MYNEWSLDVFYKGMNDPALENDMKKLEGAVADYKSVISTLSYDDTVGTLRKIIDLKETISLLVRRLSGYFSLRRSTNSADSEVSVPQTKIQMLMSGMAKENVMFEKYVGNIEDINEIIAKDDVLAEYSFYFGEIKQSVSHNMSDDAEAVFAKMNVSGGRAWGDLFSYLTATVEVDYKGEKTTLASIRGLAESNDAAERKAAYEAELACYSKYKDSVAFALNSIKAQVNTEAELRGYASPLDMTLEHSRMQRATLDAMLEAMREYLPKFRQYLKHKATLLGYENGLPWYEILAPMGNAGEKVFTAQEAHKYLVEHFESFAPDLAEMVDEAFKNECEGEVEQEAFDTLKGKFLQQMGNDLNTSMGVTAIFDVLKAKTNDATKLALIGSYDEVLSLSLLEKAAAKRAELAAQQTAKAACGYTVTGEGDPSIDALVMARYEAKKAKNFAEADRIRDELKAQGIEIVDMKDGASWKRV